MDLRNCLGIALLAALTASVVVVGILLLNFWAALLVGSSLAAVVLQLLGIMGLCDIKLSAVPAVLLVVSVGIAVHFTVHICLVSINENNTIYDFFFFIIFYNLEFILTEFCHEHWKQGQKSPFSSGTHVRTCNSRGIDNFIGSRDVGLFRVRFHHRSIFFLSVIVPYWDRFSEWIILFPYLVVFHWTISRSDTQ